MKRRRRIQEALNLVGLVAWWLGDKLIVMPRLGGTYIQYFILLPLALLIFLLTRVWFWRSLGRLHWRLADVHALRVAVPGFAVTSLLLYAFLVLAGIPPAQPPGHGRLSGSLPVELPARSLFPVPDRLPEPEVTLHELPKKKPPVSQPAMPDLPQQSVGDLIAQLPVTPLEEWAAAPHAPAPNIAPPAAPVNMTVLEAPTTLRLR
jgi:hypothetical protein